MNHLEYKDASNKLFKTYYDKFKKMVKQDLEGNGWFLIVKDFPFKSTTRGEKFNPQLMVTVGEDIGKWRDKNLVSLYGKTNYIIGRCRKKGPVLTLLDFQEGDYIKTATESGLRDELREFFKGTGVGVRVYKSLKITEEEPEVREEDGPDPVEPEETITSKSEIQELEMPAIKPSDIKATISHAMDMAKSLGVHETELFTGYLNDFKKAVPRTVFMKKALEKLNEYFGDVVSTRSQAPDADSLGGARSRLRPTETVERTGLASAKEQFIDDKAKARANVGALVTGDAFGDLEKSLRNTRFKWGKTIRKTLKTASDEAKKLVESSENSKGLKLKLMDTPAADIKDEIAWKVGGLRPDKYGNDSGYRKLSANKKALVDAIYKGMMAATISEAGDLEIPEDTSVVVQKPGLRAVFTKKKTIDGVEFKKGEKCVYIEKGEEHFVQRIAKKEDAEKGDLDEFEVKTNKLYKLDSKKDVKLKQRYIKTDKPIFEGPVSTADIKQGAIGDCYLIAGIYSIAEKNPQLIHSMIKDHGDGKVTVRLFKHNPDTQKLEPQYITVEKSTLSTDEHAEDSLWVQMVEKAYATLIGSVEAIGKGGQTHEVFKAMLGVESNRESIGGGSPTLASAIESLPMVSMTSSGFRELESRNTEFNFTPEQLEVIQGLSDADLLSFGTTIERKEFKPLFANFFIAKDEFGVAAKSRDPERFATAKAAFDREKEKLAAVQDKLREIMSTENRKKAIDKLLKKSKAYKKAAKQTVLYLEDFEQIIEELNAYAKKHATISQGKLSFPVMDLIEDLQEQGTKSDFPPRDVATHSEVEISYKDEHLEVYETIMTGLKAGKYIAAGSNKNIGISQGRGHSGGESMVDGLAGQHAYSVTDVTEMSGRKFLRVANPWGNNFSRDYDILDGTLKSKTFDASDYSYLPDPEARKGGGIAFNESWIELREFAAVFRSIYMTG